jgi:hypothetical protein
MKLLLKIKISQPLILKMKSFKADIQVVEQKRSYLGQMDVNAASPLVWDFYEETLKNYAVMDVTFFA